LFVLRGRDVRRAVGAIVAALEQAWYAVGRHDKAAGLADLGFTDAVDELAQLIVTRPAGDPEPGDPVVVEVSHFYYESAVRSPIGPVLSLDDLAGWKTVAWEQEGTPGPAGRGLVHRGRVRARAAHQPGDGPRRGP